MPQKFIEIRGVDPLLFRDGRPFTAEAGGLTARSLSLPFPTTVAAFVRTQIGKQMGWDWSQHDNCIKAHSIPVHGPLLLRNGQYVIPAPKDALLDEKAVPTRLLPIKNIPVGMGHDLPEDMLPLLKNGELPQGDEEESKPTKGYNFWPKSVIFDWLENGTISDKLPRISGLPVEERIGIAIDADLKKAKEGMLYATQLRTFGEKIKAKDEKQSVRWHKYSLIVRANLADDHNFLSSGTLGGERRLTVIEEQKDTPDLWPRCPQSLKEKLSGAKYVRMLLVTHAHFEHGWKPGWLDKSGNGEAHLPCGIANVGLKLVAAATERRIPVSGWQLRSDDQDTQWRNGKPRPIRWLVPAGSVYFFEVTGGNPAALFEDAWMKPMSDNEQSQKDGLGLALWGIW